MKILKLFLIAFFIAAAGCNSKTYEKKQYVLDTKRTYPSAETKIADTIIINRFTINPVFSSKQFTYQISDFEYESDYYNEFFIPPAVMITDKVNNWLTESGLFQRVSELTGYAATPDYILEGNVNSLYCDFRDPSLPIAVMEIHFFVSENKSMKEPVIVFSKNYKYSFTFEKGVYVNLIKAFDSCLFEILTKMEKDLTESITSK
ncbi:MAG: hypothetical protein JXA96_00790 [Sedimentisphaerales bacterium]|nr:hypothetical protein [Sedimentisphaerales bacterium]